MANLLAALFGGNAALASKLGASQQWQQSRLEHDHLVCSSIIALREYVAKPFDMRTGQSIDRSGMQPRALPALIAIWQRCTSKNRWGEGVTDPVELLCRARTLRGLAEQTRSISATISSPENQRSLASHAAVLDGEAERL